MHSSFRKSIIISIGPTLAVILWTFFDLVPGEREATWMAGILLWMAWWWLTESVHFAITALIPVIALPALGIADIPDTLMEYADRIIFVFIGGFIIAQALEKWDLHRRFALFILSRSGSSAAGVLLGILITTFVISMWISNTATVLMLLPAVLAVTKETASAFEDEKAKKQFYKALILGLAYAATIGGMATLVGTPTNMIFYGKMIEEFGNESRLTFSTWFIFAAPLALLLLVCCYFILRVLFLKGKHNVRIDNKQFRNDMKRLGPMTREQYLVGGIFLLTAFAWFSRADLQIGDVTLQGWGDLIPIKYKFFRHDFLPAMFFSLILLLIPSRSKGNLVAPRDLLRIPFDIVLLFGGGFAMAMGIEASGLSAWIAGGLAVFRDVDPVLFVAGMCLLICIISEFASNVACIQLMLPILLAFYPSLGVNAIYLAGPAALAASLGFMLPVATAPNTIAFSTRMVKVNDMLKAGFFLNLSGILLITLFTWAFGHILLRLNIP